jgi:hypothetical protein
MSTKNRKQELEEQVKDLELKQRELSVTCQEFNASIENRKQEEFVQRQELLRRAIEVASNAVSKVPRECIDHTAELYSLMTDAAKKLRESIKSNF